MKRTMAAFAFVSFAFAAYLKFDISQLGFPDGHLTEFERAYRIYFSPLIMVGAAFATFFIFAALAPESKISIKLRKAVSIGYVLIVLVATAAGYYLSTILENGGGG